MTGYVARRPGYEQFRMYVVNLRNSNLVPE
jgi:hypothetical protein